MLAFLALSVSLDIYIFPFVVAEQPPQTPSKADGCREELWDCDPVSGEWYLRGYEDSEPVQVIPECALAQQGDENMI